MNTQNCLVKKSNVCNLNIILNNNYFKITSIHKFHDCHRFIWMVQLSSTFKKIFLLYTHPPNL